MVLTDTCVWDGGGVFWDGAVTDRSEGSSAEKPPPRHHMSNSPELVAPSVYARLQAELPQPPEGFHWLLLERKSTMLPDECWLVLMLKRTNKRPGWVWLSRTVLSLDVTELFVECPRKMSEEELRERVMESADHLLSAGSY